MKRPLKFLASILAGVSLGILFAPERGKELRKRLSGSSDKVGDFGKELLLAARDASQEVQKFLKREEVQKLISSGKSEWEDFLKMARKKGTSLSDRAKKELSNLVDTLDGKKKTGKRIPRRKQSAKKKS